MQDAQSANLFLKGPRHNDVILGQVQKNGEGNWIHGLQKGLHFVRFKQ